MIDMLAAFLRFTTSPAGLLVLGVVAGFHIWEIAAHRPKGWGEWEGVRWLWWGFVALFALAGASVEMRAWLDERESEERAAEKANWMRKCAQSSELRDCERRHRELEARQ